jgi:large subunit ribosomal protein L3
MQGLIGKKIGMTQVFDAEGRLTAVTVIEAGPCVVVQRKTRETDGYEAVQAGFGERKASRTGKAAAGHFRKAGVSSRAVLREFSQSEGEDAKVGDTVGVDMFEGVPFVDVTGTTKGRGFQGVVRRHGMAGGPMTHGGHSKRRIGAIGQRERPGKMPPGKRMPGHMGHVQVTQQNLRVVQVRKEENLLIVRGAVPGPNGSVLLVRKSLKRKTAPGPSQPAGEKKK